MTTQNGKSSILIIYTGGTIGMKEDPEKGLVPYDFSQILDEVPELRKFTVKIDSYTFDPLLDSSDIEPSIWMDLARLIRSRYDEYDGFVILHGTDTMAYSASALSFIFENLDKPVIFTGSQLPIGRPRTDGRENLISAIEIASTKRPDGKAMVPEVCIFFNSNLYRGNRCTKVNATGFDAFASPNYPALATAGIDIKYNEPYIHQAADGGKATIVPKIDTRVAILKMHPGITAEITRSILCKTEARAIIIETYGSGNASSKDWLREIIRESISKGKILINITQCNIGEVNMDLYATGRSLRDAGVLSGHDSTTESALSKLFMLLGKYDDREKIISELGKNLRGEISV